MIVYTHSEALSRVRLSRLRLLLCPVSFLTARHGPRAQVVTHRTLRRPRVHVAAHHHLDSCAGAC